MPHYLKGIVRNNHISLVDVLFLSSSDERLVENDRNALLASLYDPAEVLYLAKGQELWYLELVLLKMHTR